MESGNDIYGREDFTQIFYQRGGESEPMGSVYAPVMQGPLANTFKYSTDFKSLNLLASLIEDPQYFGVNPKLIIRGHAFLKFYIGFSMGK